MVKHKKGGLTSTTNNSLLLNMKKNILRNEIKAKNIYEIIKEFDREKHEIPEKKENEIPEKKENEILSMFNIQKISIITEEVNKLFENKQMLFDEYNKTNKGIILSDSLIFSYVDSDTNTNTSGGGCFDFLKGKIKSDVLAADIIKFCNDNRNTDDILQNFITSTSTNTLDTYATLKKFIIRNRTEHNDKYTLQITSNNSIDVVYNYYEYNKDIVLAYEINFIENIANIHKYIFQHKIYLQDLSDYDKATIAYFTEESSFKFYKLFKLNNEKWINICNFQKDAFLEQIKSLGYNDGDGIIDSYNNDSRYILSIEEWRNVLNKFSDDLDRIINNSPPLENNIYCYRGASKHYINDNISESITSDMVYKFNEQTSFTLIFDVAYKFYMQGMGDNSERCIYRTTLMKGSKALFIAPLSTISNEIEILIPSNSVALTNSKKIEDNYNNAKNKFDICSSKQIFKSLDLIITTTEYTSISSSHVLDTIEINDENFSIVTANINELSTNNIVNSKTKINELIKKIIKNRPKLVCIQESNDVFKNHMSNNKYKLIASNDNRKNELIEIYAINDKSITLSNNKLIETNFCYTKRTDIIINIIYKEKNLNIGIVHLCGGKYDENEIMTEIESVDEDTYYVDKDDELNREKISDNEIDIEYENMIKHFMLNQGYDDYFINSEIEKYRNDIKTSIPEKLRNFDAKIKKIIKIRKKKCEQIKIMIENDADIILGDFNSDFEYFLGNKNKNQIEFLRKKGFDIEAIDAWNKYIYKLLNINGYKIICNDMCNELYSEHHTSIFQISPDVIYYKEKNLNINQYELINIIRGKYSDHNGIYANFI